MIVLFDSTVIGDRTPEGRRIYKTVTEKTGIKFHPTFRYCEDDLTPDQTAKLHNMGYELKYFSGCFNPYLCKRR